jgi:hypothetical protein
MATLVRRAVGSPIDQYDTFDSAFAYAAQNVTTTNLYGDQVPSSLANTVNAAGIMNNFYQTGGNSYGRYMSGYNPGTMGYSDPYVGSYTSGRATTGSVLNPNSNQFVTMARTVTPGYVSSYVQNSGAYGTVVSPTNYSNLGERYSASVGLTGTGQLALYPTRNAAGTAKPWVSKFENADYPIGFGAQPLNHGNVVGDYENRAGYTYNAPLANNAHAANFTRDYVNIRDRKNSTAMEYIRKGGLFNEFTEVPSKFFNARSAIGTNPGYQPIGPGNRSGTSFSFSGFQQSVWNDKDTLGNSGFNYTAPKVVKISFGSSSASYSSALFRQSF